MMDYKDKIREILKDNTIPPEQREKLEEILLAAEKCEEERMKEEILSLIRYTKGRRIGYEPHIHQDKMIAWLEKQGQVKESQISQHENKTCKENDDSLTSHDERIGKDIVSFLRSKNGYMTPNEDWDFHNRWLPWLERQGKYKSPEEVLKIRQELYQSGYNDGYKYGCEDTKKKGEKPQGKSASEAIEEEKVDNANKVEPPSFDEAQGTPIIKKCKEQIN